MQGVGDYEQVVDARCVVGLLDTADRLAIQAGEFPESLLCQLLALAFDSDVASDRLSAGWYPVGQRVGWHGLTLVGPVIFVCTTVGTFLSALVREFASLI